MSHSELLRLRREKKFAELYRQIRKNLAAAKERQDERTGSKGRRFHARSMDGESTVVEHMTDNRYVASQLRSIKGRAKRNDRECTLTKEQLAMLFWESRGVCSITGIPFEFDYGNSWRRPWSPSVDRIDARLGYTKENCRVVCTAVNVALNDFGEDVLRRIAVAIVKLDPNLMVGN